MVWQLLLCLSLLCSVDTAWSSDAWPRTGQRKSPETVCHELLTYKKKHRKFPPRNHPDVERIIKRHRNGSLPQDVFDRLSQAGFVWRMVPHRVRSQLPTHEEQTLPPEIQPETVHLPVEIREDPEPTDSLPERKKQNRTATESARYLLTYVEEHGTFPPRRDPDVQRVLRRHKQGMLTRKLFVSLQRKGFRFEVNPYPTNRARRISRQNRLPPREVQPETLPVLAPLLLAETLEIEADSLLLESPRDSPPITFRLPLFPEEPTEQREDILLPDFLAQSPVGSHGFLPMLQDDQD